MKQLGVLCVAAAFCVPVQSQSLSHFQCQANQQIMEGQVLMFRDSGIPVGQAEEIWNTEDDARTRVFLKRVTRQIYKNPTAGRKYLQSGQFMDDCVKTHRGY